MKKENKWEGNTKNPKNVNETGISSNEFHTMVDWTEKILSKTPSQLSLTLTECSSVGLFNFDWVHTIDYMLIAFIFNVIIST